MLATSKTTFETNYPHHSTPGIMKYVGLTIKKDLRLWFRYRANFYGNVIEIAIRIAIFGMLASFTSYAGDNSLAGKNLFVFFIGGFLLWTLSSVALFAPVNAIGRDLYNGTVEFLYATPMHKYYYFMGTVLAEAIVRSFIFFPILGLLWYVSQISFLQVIIILLVCILILTVLISLGVILALTALMWRQVTSITSVMFIVFEFLTGTYFPVQSFPKFLQYISYLLPYTWGYDLIRYYSLEGNWVTLLPIWMEWLLILIFGVLFLILSLALLKKAEKVTKQAGLNLI